MNNSIDQVPVICVHEDRPHNLIGAKLTILSLLHHCPDLPIVISCPQPPSSFCNWIESLTNVKLISFPELGKLGWNIKPVLFLRLFEAGYSEIIWIDSDIIVNGNVISNLLRYSADTLVATQEQYWGQKNGGSFRTLAWGLTPERDLPCTINTGLMRVTTQHLQLIKAWQIMSNHPSFVHVQSLPWYERPLHMVGGQDVLTALMGSTEFPNIPVVLLKRGVDIAQCFGPAGFTPIERLRSLYTGLPPLIHAMGSKPWNKSLKPPAIWNSQKPLLTSLREYYSYLSLELSPYVPIACQYRGVLEDDTEWMDTKSTFGRLMAVLTGSNPILQGFLLSLVDSVARRIRRYLKIARYSTNPEFFLKESPLKQQ